LLLATPAAGEKFGTQAEDVLFAYQRDILFGGDGSDILGTLMTDKGQNRLYGGEDKISIAGVNDRLFGKRATISCSLAMAAVP